MNADRDGRKVRCVVKDKYGNSVKTDAAALTMEKPLSITAQPQSVTVADGERATVTVGATGEGLTYTWYYLNKGASSYLKTTSFTGNTYSVIMNADRDGRKVRCIVKDKYGNSIKTDAATLSMESPLEITAQPQNVTVEVGGIASFAVSVSGGTAPYTYQWECWEENEWYTAVDEGWADGADTDTLSFEVTSDEFVGGYRYRCIITDAKGNSVTSNEAWVEKKDEPLTITKQPQAATLWIDGTASFSVSISGGKAPYTYQWERKTGESGVWYSLGSAPANGTTDHVTVHLVDKNNFYRCVITDANGDTVTSEAAGIAGDLTIQLQPQNVDGEIGDTVSFTVVAEGGTAPYTYQWQIRDDMNDWNDAGAWAEGGQTDTLSFEVAEDEFEGAYEYRCVITDVNGRTVVSDAVRVCGPLTIFGQPKDVFANVGDTVSFRVTVIGGVEPYTYQWQYMNRANSVWTDIAVDFEWATGEQTNRLSFTVGTGEFIDGGEARYFYRCIITDAEGQTVTSYEAGVTEAGPLTITAQPQNVQNVDVGDQVTFSVTAAGGDRAYGYQWYEKYNYQTSFYEIEGANSATYTRTISENDRKYDVEFFCRVTDGTGAEIDSDSAKATYKLWIKSQSVTLHKVSVGDVKTLLVTPAGGSGTYTYKWEVYYFHSKKWGDASLYGWIDKDTTSTPAMRFTVAKEWYDLYSFRCIVSDGVDTVYTETIGLEIV